MEDNRLPMTYPRTKRIHVVDTYFGTPVEDPYRWLEDDGDEATRKWVEAQNKTTFDYLDRIPYRHTLKKRLETISDYEKVYHPRREGAYCYFYRNDGLQDHAVFYRRKDGDAREEVFLDPNTFSEDGTTAMDGVYFSKDGSLAAYMISEGGSDWRKAIVLDTETKAVIGRPLTGIKFSGLSWRGNEGFYYASYDKPGGSELSAKTDRHKVYFHKLGTPQAEDRLLFGGLPKEKYRYVGAKVTEDQRYLVVSAANSTSGNKLFLKDLEIEGAEWVTLVGDTDSDGHILANEGTSLFMATNRAAPNTKVVQIDLVQPEEEHWKDLIPETEHVLTVSSGGGYFFAKYMVDATSKVLQYDYQGRLIREVDLPGTGTVHGFDGKREASVVYFYFTNYHTPLSSYAFQVDKGSRDLYHSPEIAFDTSAYTSEQVFYTSKDGTRIPMILSYKKDLQRNGGNPTMLYGYGGFNISLRPGFSEAMAVWMELGGIYAVPNLRGGGEYGKNWHLAGTKMKKQNVFDDCISAAEFLIEKGYTTPAYLALRGGSNGGLLVGAVMTQRPDLFQVALPAVGVLDMLRYHVFTSGAGWAYDYGTAEDGPEMFEYLRSYSPLHNLHEGQIYPATLVTTGNHDDRVVPAHSFKFAAELQAKQQKNRPALIRIDIDTGHGAGTPIGKTLDQLSDILAFTLFNMGYAELPDQS